MFNWLFRSTINQSTTSDIKYGSLDFCTRSFSSNEGIAVIFGCKDTYIEPDMFAFALNEECKIQHAADIVFYNNDQIRERGSIRMMGKILEEEGEIDGVYLSLKDIPARIKMISFVIAEYEAERHGFHCTKYTNPFLRITKWVHPTTISETYSLVFTDETATAVEICTLTREEDIWILSGSDVQKKSIMDFMKLFGAEKF